MIPPGGCRNGQLLVNYSARNRQTVPNAAKQICAQQRSILNIAKQHKSREPKFVISRLQVRFLLPAPTDKRRSIAKRNAAALPFCNACETDRFCCKSGKLAFTQTHENPVPGMGNGAFVCLERGRAVRRFTATRSRRRGRPVRSHRPTG